jgi:hypothetical protein
MRDLHHARGSASGHYYDRGGKSGGDEERGRERDRYNERDRNRGWQCDAYKGWRSRVTNNRNNEKDRNNDFQRSGDRDGDRDRDRGIGRERQYKLTQRPSKQFNIELNKQVMRLDYQ